MALEPALYGLMAEFENPSDLLQAARAARAQGYTRMDAYSPYPVEGLSEALGFEKTRVPLLVFLGGLTGGVGGFLMQYYCAAISYPIDIGGRPLNSWPSFIPVTFELTILCAALTAVIGMLALNGLPTPYHPTFNVPRFALATRDRFFLCIEASDALFELERTRQFMSNLRPRELTEVPE